MSASNASGVVVRSVVAEHVWKIMINRPQVRNAVDRGVAEALKAEFMSFERDDSARVAVLCGAGGHFCAGADLKAIAGATSEMNQVAELGPMGPTGLTLSKPVIAAVEGYAVAGGLELAVWCDVRVMAKSATFGVYCRRFGVPLIDGGTVRLPRLIGLSRAMDMILTGRAVDSAEALAMGLANRVMEDGTAVEKATELAALIASFPQECMRNDRMSALMQAGMPLNDALRQELMVYGRRTLVSEGFHQGAQKFFSSRRGAAGGGGSDGGGGEH